MADFQELFNQFLKDGTIWFDKDCGSWCRKCKLCGSDIKHLDKTSKYTSVRFSNLKKGCSNCRGKCVSKSLMGKPLSENHKKILSEAALKRVIHGMKGKKHSEETKHSWSIKRKGKQWRPPLSKESLIKLSNSLKGQKRTNESKKKMRQKRLDWIEKTKGGVCIDSGSMEWFDEINTKGFNFKQSYKIKDMGYVVDGYDKEKHIICEYDTPYHKKPNKIKKDLIRQNNIIQYFESINNPLTSFIRVNAKDNYKISDIDTVYGKKII